MMKPIYIAQIMVHCKKRSRLRMQFGKACVLLQHTGSATMPSFLKKGAETPLVRAPYLRHNSDALELTCLRLFQFYWFTFTAF